MLNRFDFVMVIFSLTADFILNFLSFLKVARTAKGGKFLKIHKVNFIKHFKTGIC